MLSSFLSIPSSQLVFIFFIIIKFIWFLSSLLYSSSDFYRISKYKLKLDDFMEAIAEYNFVDNEISLFDKRLVTIGDCCNEDLLTTIIVFELFLLFGYL